jgi:hypothetical protein
LWQRYSPPVADRLLLGVEVLPMAWVSTSHPIPHHQAIERSHPLACLCCLHLLNLNWHAQGLIVQMQHFKPDPGSDTHTWDLHSITFDAARWLGPWPKDLNPETVTPDERSTCWHKTKRRRCARPKWFA